MIVLHSTALLDAVLDQSGGAWVIGRIRSDVVAAPGHQLAEAITAVHRLLAAGLIERSVCSQAVADMASLPQQVAVLSPDLAMRAHSLRDRVRASDGIYVALAEQLDCDLVTSDSRLADLDLPCRVQLPQTWDY